MANIKQIMNDVRKSLSLRGAEKELGISYSKVRRLHKGSKQLDDSIDDLESVRKYLKISPSTFWQKLTGGK